MGPLLGDVAWAVMGTDGGATGPLFGSFFMGMSSAAPGENNLNGATLAAMFAAGLASLQKQTKAQVGDKTIVDALVPAIAAMEEAGKEIIAVTQRMMALTHPSSIGAS